MSNHRSFITRSAAGAAVLGIMTIALVSPLRAQHAPMEGQAEITMTAGASATLRWNEAARAIAKAAADYGGGHTHPLGGRTYAYVSLAQLAVLESADASIATPLAVAAASAGVLSGLFPMQSSAILSLLEEDVTWAGAGDEERVRLSRAFGDRVAARVLALAGADGSDGVWSGTIRSGEAVWRSDAMMAPMGTSYGIVRPWLVTSPAELRAPAPPEVGSPEFEAALEEVRSIASARTPEQTALALKWIDPVDGYWNEVAAAQLDAAGMNDREAARVLTLMNVGVMDALITCFDTKYHYQYPRPSHVDAELSLALALPNHPSYTSGHSCVAGAASTVLSHFFPSEAARFTAVADEIAVSRLYAGVHFRFDNDAGLEIGKAAARRTIEKNPTVDDLLPGASGAAAAPLAGQAESFGTFARRYPEAAPLLGSEADIRDGVIAALASAPGERLSEELQRQLLAGSAGEGGANVRAAGLGARVDAILERGRELQRRILDAYASNQAGSRAALVEQLVDDYLAAPEVALPARPKSRAVMDVFGEAMTGGHGHVKVAEPGARQTFAELYPQLNRAIFARQWLEIALAEPLVVPAGAPGAGDVGEVTTRYGERLAEELDGRLTAMPTPAAVSPELTTRHPRAAIILNNLHMLELTLLEILSSDAGHDQGAMVNRAVRDFTDPEQLTVSEYEWLLESLRPGLFAQGGPSLLKIERLDRNVGGLADQRVNGGHIMSDGM